MAKKKKIHSLYSFLLPRLRRLSIQWPARQEAIRRAKVEISDGLFKNGNPKTLIRYKCERCSLIISIDELEVDHRIPISNFASHGSWDSYLNALFCSADNLDALCSSCHEDKTTLETKERAEKRKKIKKGIDTKQ